MDYYKRCEQLMNSVANSVNSDRENFPWILWLGSKNEVATTSRNEYLSGKALMLDLLKHIRAIQVADNISVLNDENLKAERSKLLSYALEDDDSLQLYFTHDVRQQVRYLRDVETHGYDGKAFMQEVLGYGRAMASLLERKWFTSDNSVSTHLMPYAAR